MPAVSTAVTDPNSLRRLFGPVLVGGFFAAFCLWTAWFVTHLPIINLDQQVALPILLAVWAIALAFAGFLVGKRDGWRVGLGSGVVSALAGLLVLGSKLSEKSVAAHDAMQAATLKPNAMLILVGFVALGAALGAVAGGIAGAVRGQTLPVASSWMPRFAIVAIVCTAPLLFIGGLVTSTQSGMAVPDWPNSYGTNMFFYPLGNRMAMDASVTDQPEMWNKLLNKGQIAEAEKLSGAEKAKFIAQAAQTKIYYEHTHRLFGTLVGLVTLTLWLWSLLTPQSRGVRIFTTVVFGTVLAQGILGGVRVLQGSADVASDNRWFSMAHGILGQATFATICACTVYLSPRFRAWNPLSQLDGSRVIRAMATAALHTTLLQLIFGALYRHTRSPHALYVHIGFSFIVAILVAFVGFKAMAFGKKHEDAKGSLPALIGPLGWALSLVVALQFTLGWVAFLVGGGAEAATVAQALTRTAHQANGAAMLGLVTVVYTIAMRLSPRRRVQTSNVQPVAL